MPADPQRVLKFIRCLRLVEGEQAGQLYKPMKWHIDCINGIYGPSDSEGRRIVREAYISVPRKNAKSTFLSALCIYSLFEEPGAQVFCVANSVEQGKIIFRIIARMIGQNELLKSMCKIRQSLNDIEVPATHGRLKVLSKLAGQAYGLNPSFVVYDELFAAKTGDLYTALQTASGARREPLMISITTAGYDRNSICYQKYAYAKQVLTGAVNDPAFFAYIREASETDDWRSPEVWARVNPGWGISVKRSAFEALARQAEAAPSEENNFRQLYLNQWVAQSRRWLSMAAWDKCTSGVTPEELTEAGAEFYGGLDLSTTQDLTAFVMCANMGNYCYLYPYFFLPADTVENNHINRKIYASWVKAGALNISIGNVIDYDYIVSFIEDLGQRYNIRSIAYDPWNSTHPVARLANTYEVVKYPQSYANMSPAAKDFERGIINGSLLHTESPVLRWCADNVEIMTDKSGNIKPVKAAADQKIDGIIASIMAYDLCLKNTTYSVYEDRGIISI